MKIAKQKQIMSHIVRLLNQADNEFLKHVNNKSKLIKELGNESNSIRILPAKLSQLTLIPRTTKSQYYALNSMVGFVCIKINLSPFRSNDR